MISTESAVKCNNNNQAVVCLLYKKNLDILKLTNFYFEKNEEKRNLSISLITPKQLIPKVKLITFSPFKNIHSEMYSLLIDTYIEDPDEK